MSWETVQNGRLYTGLDERIVNREGTWVQETYILGTHSMLGRAIIGEQGEETVIETIIPSSLVDSRIKVNGKPNDILRHRVAPEFQHLLEPQPTIQPLEVLLKDVEFELQPQEAPQLAA